MKINIPGVFVWAGILMFAYMYGGLKALAVGLILAGIITYWAST